MVGAVSNRTEPDTRGKTHKTVGGKGHRSWMSGHAYSSKKTEFSNAETGEVTNLAYIVSGRILGKADVITNLAYIFSGLFHLIFTPPIPIILR